MAIALLLCPPVRLHVAGDHTGGRPSTNRRLVGAISGITDSSLVRQWTGGVAVKIF